jgi:hypothetical protein
LLAFAGYAVASLVPINTDTVRRSVVFLYSADGDGRPDRTHEVGTAFLVEIPLKAQPTRSYYALVTARHVVDPTWACLGPSNPAILYARVNRKSFDPQHDESGVVFIKVVLVANGVRTWATHTRDTVDVAVIPIQPDDYLTNDVATVRVSDFGTPDEINSVGVGDDVISAGLVPGYSGQLRNYPFFKFGKVSNIPAEDTLMPCQGQQPKRHTFWYLAATLVPGNSGSPVFILPPGNAIMRFGNARPFLLGLQSMSIVAGEIAGITPSQFIFDVIQSLPLPDADLRRGLSEDAGARPK